MERTDLARASFPELPRQQLLLTKLRAPRPASDGIVRERLLREIDRGIDGKLTLIVAPAGYGKSTLVSHWQTRSDRPSAWLSIDAGDNDFHLFLQYVIAAIQTIDDTMCRASAEAARSPAQLTSRQQTDLFLNEVAESTRPFVLILDDYHLIESAEVQDAVRHVIEHMPANMSLIVTSRKAPDIPLLRMSARGELVDLGAHELGFTADETKNFLEERRALSLTGEELAAIESWAEGWPVALRLIAGALRNRSQDRVETIIEALSDNIPEVAEYLWNEAIENLPADRRDFLLQTSILRQLNPELVVAVTENPGAAEILANLSRDNMFISRLIGSGDWHRYHHVLAEILRSRLTEGSSSESVRQLHERAARWYAENGIETEASHHAVEAQAWPLAASLLSRICQVYYDEERIWLLYQQLKDLPDEPLEIQPQLAYWLAWAKVRTGRPGEAARPMAIAERAAQVDSPSSTVVRAALQLQLLRSLFAWDIESAEAAALELMEHLGPNDDPDRARANIMLSMVREAVGRLPEANTALEAARDINSRLGVRGLQIAELSGTAFMQIGLGKLREPSEIFLRMLAIGDEWNDLPVQNAQHNLGTIHYEWNHLDTAKDCADRAEFLAQRSGAQFHLPQIAVLRARVKAASSDWDGAFDQIERAIFLGRTAGFSGILPTYDELKCRFWLRSGQLSQAENWLRHLGPEVVESERFVDVTLVLTAFRVMIELGQASETLEPLSALQRRSRERGWIRALQSLSTVRAMAQLEVGDQDEAYRSLIAALDLGSPEGFIRSYVDESPRLVPLLKRAAVESTTHRDYAIKLLEAAGQNVDAEVRSAPGAPGILSRRELDVMRLVDAGLSNRDIGDALFISEETVKTHLRRIFEKLDVTSRTQAINRARQLDLLPGR